eukprot:6690285-Heterocapsa_arctica.AAC.1
MARGRWGSVEDVLRYSEKARLKSVIDKIPAPLLRRAAVLQRSSPNSLEQSLEDKALRAAVALRKRHRP